MQIQPSQNMGRSHISGQDSGQGCEASHINQQETCGAPQLHLGTGQGREGRVEIMMETSGHLMQAELHKKALKALLEQGQLNHYRLVVWHIKSGTDELHIPQCPVTKS